MWTFDCFWLAIAGALLLDAHISLHDEGASSWSETNGGFLVCSGQIAGRLAEKEEHSFYVACSTVRSANSSSTSDAVDRIGWKLRAAWILGQIALGLWIGYVVTGFAMGLDSFLGEKSPAVDVSRFALCAAKTATSIACALQTASFATVELGRPVPSWVLVSNVVVLACLVADVIRDFRTLPGFGANSSLSKKMQ